MKNKVVKKFFWVIALVMCLSLSLTAFARSDDEMEPASISQLLGVGLPANAQRVLPQSVPAEINQTLDTIVSAGKGKVNRGDSEVLMWAETGFKKVGSSGIANQLRRKLQAGGWQFEMTGQESEVSFFTLFKDGERRRAVIGFYVATEEAFVLALSELVKAENGVGNGEAPQQNETPAQTEKTALNTSPNRARESAISSAKWK